MLKNIKIGVKLIVVGVIIVMVPLALVAAFAIMRSTQGLTTMEDEQLTARSKDIAQMLDKVISEEKKIVTSLSIDPDIIAAAAAVANPGNGDAKAPSAADLAQRVSDKLATFAKTQGLGESYLAIVCTGPDGITWAASDPSSLGVNASDRQYFKDAMAGASECRRAEPEQGVTETSGADRALQSSRGTRWWVWLPRSWTSASSRISSVVRKSERPATPW